jgi:integrase
VGAGSTPITDRRAARRTPSPSSAGIDATGDVWQARLERHKGAWRGKERIIFFGEKAKEIIRPYLLRPADKPMFSPHEAILSLRRDCPTHRRPNQKPNERQTAREVRDAYTPDTYRRAVTRACVEAGIPSWVPYQLRHTAGTEARKRFGLDVAQALLGHSGAKVTQIYAELDQEKARAIAAQFG